MRIDAITVEGRDSAAADAFYAALGLNGHVRVRTTTKPTTGFRGFTLSLLLSQPGDVDLLVGAALDAGATTIKPVAKSLWGYGGVVQGPDGTIVKIATSSKKNTRPAARTIDDIVLLLGATDVKATGASTSTADWPSSAASEAGTPSSTSPSRRSSWPSTDDGRSPRTPASPPTPPAPTTS